MMAAKWLAGRWRRVSVATAQPFGSGQRTALPIRLGACAAVFVLSGWVTVTTVNYFGSRHLLSDAVGQIKGLEQAYADLLAESEQSAATLTAQIEALEAQGRQQQEMIAELQDLAERRRTTIAELTAIQHTLERQLASRERQLASLTEQRDRARRLVVELEQAIGGVETLVQSVLDEKSVLAGRLEAAEQELAEVIEQRDAGRRVEVGLRWEVARLENEVRSLRDRREMAQIWLKDWVLGSAEALEQLFAETGVDVEELIGRAGSPETGHPEIGQGGPLQVASIDPVDEPRRPLPPPDPMSDNIQRLAALQKLARTLPLASPLDHFYITSRYGERRDPFTKEWAFHAGLDFGAARGSKVLATAPGRVTYAGPADAYGNMVEIDHGMGVVTRYGHMKSVSVEVGEEVGFRQPVGVIGSTGRSTALHLHYEIRIDDVAQDPARFLDAGRLLVGIFAATGSGGQDQQG